MWEFSVLNKNDTKIKVVTYCIIFSKVYNNKSLFGGYGNTEE